MSLPPTESPFLFGIRPGPAGDARLPLRAAPGARKEGLSVEADGTLKLHIRAPAVDGAANKALLDVLAKHILGISRSAVSLEQGEKGRNKVFRIALSPATLEERLQAQLPVSQTPASPKPVSQTPATPKPNDSRA
jgi:uncharacterized protein YggU (UPF0235/DUF167 family)